MILKLVGKKEVNGVLKESIEFIDGIESLLMDKPKDKEIPDPVSAYLTFRKGGIGHVTLNGDAYLLNDEGRTIERLIVPTRTIKINYTQQEE